MLAILLMISHFFAWGLFGIVLMAMALVHYFRRQPSFYWLYLIIFLGPLGALIYLAIEWLPELFDPGAIPLCGARPPRARGGSRHPAESFGGKLRRARPAAPGQRRLVTGPAPALTAPWHSAPIRSIPSTAAAWPNGAGRLCRRSRRPGARRHRRRRLRLPARRRTAGLLPIGRPAISTRAQRLFEQVLRTSTLTETQLHYAEFLAETGHRAEAKQQALRIRDKRAGMPGFQRRRERKLFRRNSALLRLSL